MLENDVELARNRILKDKVNPGSLTHKQQITCICISFFQLYKPSVHIQNGDEIPVCPT